jgi:hypothetical protein
MAFHNDKKNDAKLPNDDNSDLDSDNDAPPQESLVLTKTFQGTPAASDKTIKMQTWVDSFVKKHIREPFNRADFQAAEAGEADNHEIQLMANANNAVVRIRNEIRTLIIDFTRHLSQASTPGLLKQPKTEDNEKTLIIKYLILPAYHLPALTENNLLTPFISEACEKLKLKELGDNIRILIETTPQWTKTRAWEGNAPQDFANAVFPVMVDHLAGLQTAAQTEAKIKDIAEKQGWHGTEEIASEYMKAIQDKLQEPLSNKSFKH